MKTTGIIAAVLGTLALVGAGCVGTETGKEPSGIQAPGLRPTQLLDAAIARKIRDRTTVAPDPFGNSGLVILGDKAHHDEQKICIVSGEGFFSIPADPAGQSVVFRLAVQGPLGVRIVFATTNGIASYPVTLTEEGKWLDVAVPLAAIAKRLGPGERVVDITLLQKDLTHKGMLYLHSAVLTRNAADSETNTASRGPTQSSTRAVGDREKDKI